MAKYPISKYLVLFANIPSTGEFQVEDEDTWKATTREYVDLNTKFTLALTDAQWEALLESIPVMLRGLPDLVEPVVGWSATYTC